MAANNLLFPQTPSPSTSSTPNLPLNIDVSANAANNQLALLQSFTSEMTIPTQAAIFHHHHQQQQQQTTISKNEINNNGSSVGGGGDEHMASGSQ